MDLYIGIDCSGSMPAPRVLTSYPALAGTIVCLSALRAGARVKVVLSGEPEGKTFAMPDFERDERTILDVLTGYLGTGIGFGVHRLADTFDARTPRDRAVHVLLLSDHDLFRLLAHEEDGVPGWDVARRSLAAARGGGTVVLNMPRRPNDPGDRAPRGGRLAGPLRVGLGGADRLRARVLASRVRGGGAAMSEEGPELASLLRRLTECPAEFLDEPRIGESGRVVVSAVVFDLVEELGGVGAPHVHLPFASSDPSDRNALRIVLIACWLLHDPWFRARRDLGARAHAFLVEEPPLLAKVVEAERFVTDPERREELVRHCLARLALRPRGETEAQADDRRTSLDSLERRRVIEATRAAEERAREVREALERKAAEEAAAKATRE